MNHKILALLRENARMGIQEIALRSGLPEAEAAYLGFDFA